MPICFLLAGKYSRLGWMDGWMIHCILPVQGLLPYKVYRDKVKFAAEFWRGCAGGLISRRPFKRRQPVCSSIILWNRWMPNWSSGGTGAYSGTSPGMSPTQLGAYRANLDSCKLLDRGNRSPREQRANFKQKGPGTEPRTFLAARAWILPNGFTDTASRDIPQAYCEQCTE